MMKTDGLVAEIDINPVIVSSKGAVAADARLILSAQEVRTNGKAASPDRSASALEKFKPLFEPKTVAVLGASTRDVAIANTFIRRMKAFDYPGQIYPIHPSASEVEGLKAYPSLGSTPEPVDYAYVAIGAERIPGAIAEANGRCRIAQVISSGFAEVEGGIALEHRPGRKGACGRRPGARPQYLGDLFAAWRPYFSAECVKGSRDGRHRVAVGWTVD